MSSSRPLSPRVVWAIPLLLLLGLLLVVGQGWIPGPVAQLPPGPDSTPAAASGAATVVLQLDFGDGRPPASVEVPFAAETELSTVDGQQQVMTVGDLLRAASRDDERFRFTQKGEAGQSLLTSLGGVTNEGSGPTARNWMFYVEGERGDRSFDVFPLQVGETVLWRFETYR